MKKTFLFLYGFVSYSILLGQKSILSIAKQTIDSQFVISYYNHPSSENGVIIFEETHNRQENNAYVAKRIHTINPELSKIGLEGLYKSYIKLTSRLILSLSMHQISRSTQKIYISS